MKTKVYIIEDIQKDDKAIEEAAALIRQGQLVAFPTETVYGLGANALDGQAVNRIFEAKGRPNDNPLIVHVSKKEDIEPLVLEVPARVYTLIDTFWPGPLTIILKKAQIVPDETTAGLSTVALRMPNHPIALALIDKAGVPIAAPSANRSGKPSPTTAQHVIEDLSNIIPMILDGIVPCQVGIESTVLDMSGEVPTILRPGGITLEMLRPILEDVRVDETVLKPLTKGQSPKSPGMKYTHYAPKAKVIIYRGTNLDAMAAEINRRAEEYVSKGKKVGILATDETMDKYKKGHLISLGSRKAPASIASSLFNSLRGFDHIGVDVILAEWVEEKDEGLAVMNRMIRAAGFHVINVSS
ncbi:MAG: L-threonylcarbamoyladenylate synthase [Caldicoprobacterales bacterium]|nr:threonylcarbamoyl-AMP synthase [Clostridiales bacterium]